MGPFNEILSECGLNVFFSGAQQGIDTVGVSSSFVGAKSVCVGGPSVPQAMTARNAHF